MVMVALGRFDGDYPKIKLKNLSRIHELEREFELFMLKHPDAPKDYGVIAEVMNLEEEYFTLVNELKENQRLEVLRKGSSLNEMATDNEGPNQIMRFYIVESLGEIEYKGFGSKVDALRQELKMKNEGHSVSLVLPDSSEISIKVGEYAKVLKDAAKRMGSG